MNIVDTSHHVQSSPLVDGASCSSRQRLILNFNLCICSKTPRSSEQRDHRLLISAAYCSADWLIWLPGWLTDWLVGWLVSWCHFFSELKTRTKQSLVHARQVLNYPATPPDMLTLKTVRFFAEEALWPASTSSNTSTVCSSKPVPALCTCSLHSRVTSTQCNNQQSLPPQN